MKKYNLDDLDNTFRTAREQIAFWSGKCESKDHLSDDSKQNLIDIAELHGELMELVDNYVPTNTEDAKIYKCDMCYKAQELVRKMMETVIHRGLEEIKSLTEQNNTFKNENEKLLNNETYNAKIGASDISGGKLNINNESKTINATCVRLKSRILTLTSGYADAAKLAHAITAEGPQRGGNPWTEEEILKLAVKLGVSIKGDCLKAFKAGMPADLVKKDAGARPTTPREESPDDVET